MVPHGSSSPGRAAVRRYNLAREWKVTHPYRVQSWMWNATAAAIVVAAVTLATGCRKERPKAPPPASPTIATRVALVAAARVPAWWLDAAKAGLARVAETRGSMPMDLGRVAPEAYRDAVRQLGQSGVELIFCLGDGWAQVVYTESVAFPDSHFVVIGAEASGGSSAGVTFVGEEATYLGGVLAAALHDSQVAGILSGGGGPWLDRLESGYVAGFRSSGRKTEVERFEGRSGVGGLVEAGARVALYAAESADPEVLAAARAAGLDLIVVDPEPLKQHAEGVVAAVSINLAEAMVRVAQDADREDFRGRTFAFDLGSGIVDLQVAPSLLASENAAVIDALAQARAEITAGIAEIEKLGF
jgi:basic membrane lipoprotein Med (substrate-binding protein (PBP1-ABC) superfamily)